MLEAIYGFQRHNLFCPPDWRWRAACILARSRRRSRRAIEIDAGVSMLAGYLRNKEARRRRPVGPLPDYSPIQAALSLYESGGDLRNEVQARILARQTDVEIGAVVGLTPEVVLAFEWGFFAVRDRIDARDWIKARAIGVRFLPGDNAAIWKHFAYYGGPLVLESVMAVTLNRPLPPDTIPTDSRDPLYEEWLTRLLCSLNIAELQAPTPADLAPLIRVYNRAVEIDRQRVDRPSTLCGLEAHEMFFDMLARSSGRRRKKKDVVSAEELERYFGPSPRPNPCPARAFPVIEPETTGVAHE